jgi:hypothetical protein
MSVLSKQPLKILLTLSKLLVEDGFNYQNPWDYVDDNMEKLKSSGSWLGESLDEDDMEFISAFIIENLKTILSSIHNELTNSEAVERMLIPQKKKFKAYYEIWGSASLTEKYKTIWECYYKEWVNDSLRYSYNDGSWDYYDGDYLEHETDNFEPDNFDITYVEKLREGKKPILDRLVVENTKDLLENLDRETLVKLRNLINEKLSS